MPGQPMWGRQQKSCLRISLSAEPNSEVPTDARVIFRPVEGRRALSCGKPRAFRSRQEIGSCGLKCQGRLSSASPELQTWAKIGTAYKGYSAAAASDFGASPFASQDLSAPSAARARPARSNAQALRQTSKSSNCGRSLKLGPALYGVFKLLNSPSKSSSPSHA